MQLYYGETKACLILATRVIPTVCINVQLHTAQHINTQPQHIGF